MTLTPKDRAGLRQSLLIGRDAIDMALSFLDDAVPADAGAQPRCTKCGALHPEVVETPASGTYLICHSCGHEWQGPEGAPTPDIVTLQEGANDAALRGE